MNVPSPEDTLVLLPRSRSDRTSNPCVLGFIRSEPARANGAGRTSVRVQVKTGKYSGNLRLCAYSDGSARYKRETLLTGKKQHMQNNYRFQRWLQVKPQQALVMILRLTYFFPDLTFTYRDKLMSELFRTNM